MAEDKEIIKYSLLTGIAAVAAPWALPKISELLSKGGFFDVSLQSVATIKVNGLGTLVNTGLTKYGAKILSVLPTNFGFQEYFTLFIGGVVFGLLGYLGLKYAVQPLLKAVGVGLTNATLKLMSVLTIGSLITAAILAMKLSVPGWEASVTLVLTALIFAAIAQGLLVLAGVEKSM
jgi:hypothetical protein